jgi:ApbE superfamily uncharacterized protein (UPF0280 family)
LEKETDLQILTNRVADHNFLKERINHYRSQIEAYIAKDRRFLVSLKPLAVELAAPKIIQEMAGAAAKANVGPMATVAGAIADFLGRDLVRNRYKEVIIENGGDIFIKSAKMRKIGIYAGKSRLWNKLCLKVKPADTPLGVCTSSGTIGHSLSFGQADSVVILARSATLADAVATATGNLVHAKADLQRALDFARSIKGVLGVVIILKNNLISWGKIEFTR